MQVQLIEVNKEDFANVDYEILFLNVLAITITALYNLNNESYNPAHPHRFQELIQLNKTMYPGSF
jgi:hypothetical protein